MKRNISHRLADFVSAAAAVSSAAVLLTPAALAQDSYPSRPVHVIVPFSTDGAADVSARLIGAKLGETLKQPFVIENHAGGEGIPALDLVKRAAPDGHTLGIISNANAARQATMRKLPWDLDRDFAYIAVAVVSTIVLLGNPQKVKAASLAQLTGELRSAPEKYHYGSCGVLSTHRFAMEKYRYLTQAVARHVPYKGCAFATTDVIGGQIELAMVTLSDVLSHVKSGRLRAYGVTTAERNATAPDVPTFRESGIPELKDYEQVAWYGFAAPAGTPQPIVNKLAAEIERALASPEVSGKLRAAGLAPAFHAPKQTAAMLEAEVKSFKQVSAAAGITAE